MPPRADESSKRDVLESRLRHLRAMADAEAAHLGVPSIDGPQLFSDACLRLLLKLGRERLSSDTPSAGPHDRRLLQNVARERRRTERTWTRHHAPPSVDAEPAAPPAAPCEDLDELARLPPPLRDVAALARRGSSPAEIADELGVSEREVARLAFWILARHTDAGAALPAHLGLAPGSLAGLPRAARHRALRCLHAVGCGPNVMALDCNKRASAVQKDLERAGLARRRGRNRERAPE